MLLKTPHHRKIAFLVVGVCAIAAVGFYGFRHSGQPAYSNGASSSTQMPTRDLDQQALNFLKQPEKEYVFPDGEVLPYPPSALDKMEERNRERGYFMTEELRDYEDYPRAMLETSAYEGNLLANLALRLKLDDQKSEKARELCEVAIVYGSTEAINCMAAIASADAQDAGFESVSLGQAWYQVGVMRGDRLHERNAWEHLQDSFERPELSDAEKELVNEMAQGIYDDIARKRRDLGLPEFDNSVPEDVDLYYDYVIREWTKNYLNVGI